MTATTESPEARLYAAGFTRQLAGCLMSWSTESTRRRSPPASRRLGWWRKVIAAVTVAKLKPLVRAELRAALSTEARKQHREPSK